MPTRQALKDELSALVTEGHEAIKLLTNKKKAGRLHHPYQAWYSKALPAVRTLAPDRYEEFKRYYEPDPKRKSLGYGTYVVQDYLKGVAPNRMAYPGFDADDQTVRAIYNQITILVSIAGRIDSLLANLEGTLVSRLQTAELATARKLLPVSARAAGALAGVVLEEHLQKVAKDHNVKIAKKNPTIGDLNDPLKSAGVYDVAAWRKVSYLGDLRNLCSHKKDVTPTAEQVNELIHGVNWAVTNLS